MNDYRVEFVLVLTILTEIALQLNSTPNCKFVPSNTADRWKISPLAISSKARQAQGAPVWAKTVTGGRVDENKLTDV